MAQAGPRREDEIGSSADPVLYATIAVDELLIRNGKLPKGFDVLGSGTLVIEKNDEAATQITLPAAGTAWRFPMSPRRFIASGTNATNIIVYY